MVLASWTERARADLHTNERFWRSCLPIGCCAGNHIHGDQFCLRKSSPSPSCIGDSSDGHTQQGGIVLAHAVAWKIAIVLLAAVPVMLASGFARLKMLAKSETRHRTAYTTPTSLAIESCRARRTVTLFGLQDVVLRQYHDALMKPHKENFSFTILCNTLLAFSFSITYFVYALAYWW